MTINRNRTATGPSVLFALLAVSLFGRMCSGQAVLGQEIAQSEPSTASSGPTDQQIADWVRQLGDESFKVRRRATIRLAESGTSAKNALVSALASSDPEVRRRARQILAVVLPLDLRERLAAFAADTEGRRDFNLPGWSRFSELAGDDTAARELFVRAQYAEADLLASLDSPRDTAGELLIERCNWLRARLYGRDGHRPQPISTGSVAALFFVGSHPEVPVNSRFCSFLNSFSAREPFKSAIAGGSESAPLRKLVAAWFEKSTDAVAAANYQNISMAMRLGMPEGLPLAKSLLKLDRQSTLTRSYATLAIGKLGGREDMPLLSPLLEDTATCASLTRNSRKATTQVRDVALAVMIHLSNLSHADFGFDHVVNDPMYLFNIRSLGFVEQQQRESAIRKWKDRNDG